MRKLLPLLPLVSLGCAPSEYETGADPVAPGVVNPRPLEPVMQVDRFVQVVQPEVDVLWVVDDSSSALDEQVQLSEEFPVYMRYFGGIDFHIGVVTTDMDDPERSGRLVTKDGLRYVDSETPDPAAILAKMAIVGTSGSASERGNSATYAALHTERDAYNAGFLRDESSVHVIVVSDEQDFSDNISPEGLAAFLNDLRADPDDVTHSSIVESDSRYVPVSNAVGGLVYDVHALDWTAVIEQLGLHGTGLTREFFLSRLPVPGTIEVSVVEGDVRLTFDEGEDWAYDPVRNSIEFHEYVPNAMAEVILEYRILASDPGA